MNLYIKLYTRLEGCIEQNNELLWYSSKYQMLIPCQIFSKSVILHIQHAPKNFILILQTLYSNMNAILIKKTNYYSYNNKKYILKTDLN